MSDKWAVLNQIVIRENCVVLQVLTGIGVYIYVACHDYLLLFDLSLFNEEILE